MQEFIFEPYIGALPVTFEMTPEEVVAIFGAPKSTSVDFEGNRAEQRGVFNLSYDKEDRKVIGIGFSPNAKLLFHGRNLLKEADPVAFLSQFDPQPLELFGGAIFFGIGMTVTGFRGGVRSDKGITIFKKGTMDEVRGSCLPWPR